MHYVTRIKFTLPQYFQCQSTRILYLLLHYNAQRTLPSLLFVRSYSLRHSGTVCNAIVEGKMTTLRCVRPIHEYAQDVIRFTLAPSVRRRRNIYEKFRRIYRFGFFLSRLISVDISVSFRRLALSVRPRRRRKYRSTSRLHDSCIRINNPVED